MTIDQMKDLKRHMQGQIKRAVDDFEDQTGMEVNQIYLRREPLPIGMAPSGGVLAVEAGVVVP